MYRNDRSEYKICVTTLPARRKDEWEKQYKDVRNWSVLGPYDSRERACVVEQRLIDRFQYEREPIKHKNESALDKWYVCRFEHDGPGARY